MIPKRIINCWFGGGKKTDLFEHCLRTQREVSGWEVIEVNEQTIDPKLLETPYMRNVLARGHAGDKGEFVKATELGRLWGLWCFGGVYMDADVELLRPLNPLLSARFFIGREDEHYLNGAVLGSVPCGVVISELLDCFSTNDAGEKSAHIYGPTYLTNMLKGIGERCDFVEHPPEVFYPSHWRTPTEVRVTERTVAHHRWAASWVKK